MPQCKCVVKNSGKPTEIAKVELYDEDGKPSGKEIEVQSLLYFAPGDGVVNDYYPDPSTGLTPGVWLCSVENMK